ncbi:unnamed protein product [Citrullus colocynthis]|uniref:Uncharacterized protein n=1 Tax=Citrullus colocynthis TaxID=252529 RepID=A0ABP0Z9D1_9ROSI
MSTGMNSDICLSIKIFNHRPFETRKKNSKKTLYNKTVYEKLRNEKKNHKKGLRIWVVIYQDGRQGHFTQPVTTNETLDTIVTVPFDPKDVEEKEDERRLKESYCGNPNF